MVLLNIEGLTINILVKAINGNIRMKPEYRLAIIKYIDSFDKDFIKQLEENVK